MNRLRLLFLLVLLGSTSAGAQVINSFTADPPTIAKGQASQLSWTTTGATSADLSVNGASLQVPPSGSLSVSPGETTTYTLTAYSGSTSASANVVVTVADTPTVQFTATPSQISPGDPVNLVWSTTGATTVSINNGVGQVPLSGSRVVSSVNATTTFTLTATGPGGVTTASATVSVIAALVAGITVQPSTIRDGESANLVWVTTGGGTVTITDGTTPTTVTAEGSRVVNPNRTTIYGITVTRGTAVAASSATLTVNPASPPVISSFDAAPSSTVAGLPVALLWNSTGGTDASIDNGVGAVSPNSGSVNVSPAATTTYTLSVRGAGGMSTRTKTVVVNNAPPPTVTALAGTGSAGATDGPPGVASFTRPFAVAAAPPTPGPPGIKSDATESSDLLVLDSNHTIRRISPDGTTTTWAGKAGVAGKTNGFRTAATFDFSNYVGAIVANADGTVDVVDANGFQRRIDTAGNVASVCSSCARYPLPSGMVRLPDRTTYISDAGNHTVTRISPTGAQTVIGRVGKPGLSDGASDVAQFDRPRGLSIDSAGNVYVLDTGNNAVRKINPQNVVSTMTVPSAGKGTLVLGCCASGIAAAPGGGVYVSDPGSNTVKEVKADGSIQTVAGSGSSGASNGSGSNATFNNPLGVTTSPSGAIVVTDTNNNTVRSIQTSRKAGRGRAVKH